MFRDSFYFVQGAQYVRQCAVHVCAILFATFVIGSTAALAQAKLTGSTQDRAEVARLLEATELVNAGSKAFIASKIGGMSLENLNSLADVLRQPKDHAMTAIPALQKLRDGLFVKPVEIANDAELEDLILRSESIDDKEKQNWFDLFLGMTTPQRDRLREIF